MEAIFSLQQPNKSIQCTDEGFTMNDDECIKWVFLPNEFFVNCQKMLLKEGGSNMDYAVPVNRTISTNKTLKTVCRLDKNQRAIRDFCRTHTVVISEDKNGEPFARIQEKKDERVSD